MYRRKPWPRKNLRLLQSIQVHPNRPRHQRTPSSGQGGAPKGQSPDRLDRGAADPLGVSYRRKSRAAFDTSSHRSCSRPNPEKRAYDREPRRHRDKAHLKFVASQPCLVCGRSPADAHHLRFTQLRAMGRKVSDEFTVPLCRTHHRDVHRFGDEVVWWERRAIDPVTTARMLWISTRRIE